MAAFASITIFAHTSLEQMQKVFFFCIQFRVRSNKFCVGSQYFDELIDVLGGDDD